MAYIDHIQALNRWNPENFLPFRVDGMRMGWIRHRFAEQLSDFPECFVVSSGQVKLKPELEGFEQRSNAVATVLEHMAESGAIRHLQGEMFPVLSEFGKAAAFKIDRAVMSQFGIRAFGQHLNGYFRLMTGWRCGWVAGLLIAEHFRIALITWLPVACHTEFLWLKIWLRSVGKRLIFLSH
jgi:hypothetical protein